MSAGNLRRRASEERFAAAYPPPSGDPLEALERTELREALDRALSTLPERERTAVLAREVWGDTLREVAAGLLGGVSAERARQLGEGALRRLRHPSRTLETREFVGLDLSDLLAARLRRERFAFLRAVLSDLWRDPGGEWAWVRRSPDSLELRLRRRRCSFPSSVAYLLGGDLRAFLRENLGRANRGARARVVERARSLAADRLYGRIYL